MRYGKLTEDELRTLLSQFHFSRKEIVRGAAVGADTAAIRADGYILITTDPITADAENVGELAVDINSNDIYASFGEPFAAVMTVLAPPYMDVRCVTDEIMSAYDKAASKGIAVIGGHTEFTDAVNRLVISMTVLGKTDKLPDNTSIKSGDKVIVTKTLGIEGAKIISERKAALETLSIEQMTELNEMDLSIGRESAAVRNYEIHAMHDITEGGVCGACAEVAASAKCGIRIYESALPVSEPVRWLCAKFNLNVEYLISSGSLLIITPESDAVLRALGRVGVLATVVGEVIDGDSVIVRRSGIAEPLCIKTDELYKVRDII